MKYGASVCGATATGGECLMLGNRQNDGCNGGWGEACTQTTTWDYRIKQVYFGRGKRMIPTENTLLRNKKSVKSTPQYTVTVCLHTRGARGSVGIVHSRSRFSPL